MESQAGTALTGSDLFALSDEQILEIAPDLTLSSPMGQPFLAVQDQTSGPAVRREHENNAQNSQIESTASRCSEGTAQPETAVPLEPPAWLAAQMQDPWGGEEAREFWGGVQQARSEAAVELRQEPKYPAVNRWHIEKWLPPETYGSPRAWWAQTVEIEGGRSVPALGPYPARGEYEHCFTLEGPRGEFVQLTPTVAEHIARAIEWSRHHPRSAGKRALYDREQRQERSYDAYAYDILDDVVPAFHKQPFVTVRS